MTPSDRDAGRALLAERAHTARTALFRARAGGPGSRDTERARDALTRYAASGSELDRTDRLAHRLAQVWLEAARAHLWFGTVECGRAEATAYRCLELLPAGECTRRAVRHAHRLHRAGLRRWHARHSAAICALVGRVGA